MTSRQVTDQWQKSHSGISSWSTLDPLLTWTISLESSIRHVQFQIIKVLLKSVSQDWRTMWVRASKEFTSMVLTLKWQTWLLNNHLSECLRLKSTKVLVLTETQTLVPLKTTQSQRTTKFLVPNGILTRLRKTKDTVSTCWKSTTTDPT